MNLALRILDRTGLLAVIVVFWVIFIMFAEGFLTRVTIFGLSRTVAVTAVIGLSQMVVLGIGQMNLAVGAIGGAIAVFTGWLMEGIGLPIWTAIVLGLLFATIVGFINGIIITKTGINSFIVTLAMGSVITGLLFILTKAEAFRDLPKAYGRFGKTRWVEYGWLELSPLLFIAVVIAVIMAFVYKSTTFGRWMLATGANPRAAELSGVPINLVVQATHALSGLLAGAAGIMLVSRLGSALPSIGENWLLPSFAAPIVGGTLLAGGAVAVFGTLLGALLIESVSVGLTLMNVPSFWIQLFIGLVLLLAVLVDRARAVAITRGQRGVRQTAAEAASS